MKSRDGFPLGVIARMACLLLTLPALGAGDRVRTLYDSDGDGWRLWTAYGPAVNERYGTGNNSKHWHDPAYVVASGKARIFRAVDTGVGQAKRFMSGCLSTREASGGRGFMRFSPGIDFLRFEFTVTISDWNHAVWPALWLRGDGGAGVHEIDVLEGFTAQVGVDLYRFAVHSGGEVNVLRDPWPGTPLKAGRKACVWVEVHRPGTLDPNLAFIRAGIDGTATVEAADPNTAVWWKANYGWDMIIQQQIGGNWVGDPEKPYQGKLQNGTDGLPASEVPTWKGDSSMTVHRVKVTAHGSAADRGMRVVFR